MMDRSWISASRISVEYETGVEDFLKFAKRHGEPIDERYYCPCVNCLNGRRHKVDVIREHLLCDGFVKSYTTWTWHGELLDSVTAPSGTKVSDPMQKDANMTDCRLEDMIRDVGHESFQEAHVYDTLKSDAELPLYPGCKTFTRLSAVLRLFNVKARNGWTDKSFTELLQLLKEILPEDNTLPSGNYEAKKVLCPMGLEYQKIHACRNDCILYRNQFESLDMCPMCGVSRYKMKNDQCCQNDKGKKGAPAKVLWYLPIIPRLKRLYGNVDEAMRLTWHANGRTADGMLRHPADSPQWRKIDCLYPEFGKDPRNIRLGLATDGMNPFGNLGSTHSCWPVLLVIYNLPPWLCMKRKYVMMSMMISGPRQPGNDIDVYLRPLIEDLRLLWLEGVEVFDAGTQESFNLRALLFCTINDFPAYGNLSGYSVKGHYACPICEQDTSYQQLKHGKKTVYTRHRKFLSRNHPYRRMKKAFNGCQEEETASTPLTGEQVFERVKNINFIYGKTQKKGPQKNLWKKRSIFFYLPYWSKLEVRHCIDVMHVEKNVCDSLISTLLNVKGKTKDGLHARRDLVEMGIRLQLQPQTVGTRTYLPPACHTLSKKEKMSFCKCLCQIKVPQGYSSNIRSLVSMQDLKLVGLKSHDCHVLMQQLLPVAIRDILPINVRHAIIRLCLFFNAVCTKVLHPEQLNDLENEGVLILCELEMFFPPSFFDIMVHLIIHLVREIKLCGPVFLRWMYPIERYMKIFKGYAKNPNRPEASIVQRYIAEEAIEFCTEYMLNTPSVGVPTSRHMGRFSGKGTRGLKIKTKNRQDVLQAHLYVLNNTDEVLPYLNEHKKLVKSNNLRMNDKWVLNEHNKTFLPWFKEQVDADDNCSETLHWLAGGPNSDVMCWSGYDINGYSFYTKSQDDKSTVQNSGITLQAESLHFSSAKDKNPVTASITYYGVIDEIWDIDYTKFRIPIFKCSWVDHNNGVFIDDLGFTLVDLSTVTYTDEPFIMADQARQVFYVNDPANERLSIVLQGSAMNDWIQNEDATPDQTCNVSFSKGMSTCTTLNEEDHEHTTRTDHDEGLWENLDG